jgi:hypothetical protein
MKSEVLPEISRPTRSVFITIISAVLLLIARPAARADQVEMQNGDHYSGHVLSLDANMLVLQNDVVGKLNIPRGKVARITFGQTPPARPAAPLSLLPQTPAVPLAATTNVTDLSAALRQLATEKDLIQQVQSQILNGAGPEANQKFNQLLNGLASGKINVNDLRAQAKSSADQLRSLRREMGDEGEMLDGYLSILDAFVKESAPNTAPRKP